MFLRVVVLMCLGGLVAPASALPMAEFFGIWQGVDPEDGSLQTLTITDAGARRAGILVHDTWFSLCQGELGVGQGTGVLTRNTLEVADYQLSCGSGSARGGATRFTRGAHGVLKRVLAPPSPPIVYYRIGR